MWIKNSDVTIVGGGGIFILTSSVNNFCIIKNVWEIDYHWSSCISLSILCISLQWIDRRTWINWVCFMHYVDSDSISDKKYAKTWHVSFRLITVVIHTICFPLGLSALLSVRNAFICRAVKLKLQKRWTNLNSCTVYIGGVFGKMKNIYFVINWLHVRFLNDHSIFQQFITALKKMSSKIVYRVFFPFELIFPYNFQFLSTLK